MTIVSRAGFKHEPVKAKKHVEVYRNVSEHGIEMINQRFLNPGETAGKDMFGGRFEFYTKIGAIEEVK